MKIGFISLGCAKNLVDTENIIALFDDPYFEYEYDLRECEAILINTCAFILPAKTEAIDTILEIAEYKKDKLKKLIVTGCFSQRYYDECIREFPEVDLFVKISDYGRLPEMLSELFGHEFSRSYGCSRKLVNNSYTAYLKIADGCNKFCSFCAIPYIRGRYVSKPLNKLVEEAQFLRQEGVKELNIVAQDSTCYGKDIYGKNSLAELLKALDPVGFEWVRILYMYPEEIDEELLMTMKELEHVLPYFDIPIQYGYDMILKLMNRKGDVAMIKEKIGMIRRIFPDAVIRTTILLGFPHETDESFSDTLDLVRELRFDSLGAFTYSPEEGTNAYKLDMQIDDELKQERYEKLMLEQRKIVEEKNEEKTGRTYKVLIERYDMLSGSYVGRSYMSAPDGVDPSVFVRCEEGLKIGDFYDVEITGHQDYDLLAIMNGER